MGDQEWMLSPKEGDLLTMLCQHKNGLNEALFGLEKDLKEDSYFTGRSMDVYIAKLRKYLKGQGRSDRECAFRRVSAHG